MARRSETEKKSSSTKSNSAVLCRIYPTKEQEALLRKAFEERNRWYNMHLKWFRDEYAKASSALRRWIGGHAGADEKEIKEYSESLPWPSKTKMGWPKSVIHPNEKYLSRYGEPVSIFWNAMNEAAEDDLGRAIKASKQKGRVPFAPRRASTFTVPIATKKDIEMPDGIMARAPYAEIMERGGTKLIRVPFVSPSRRKERPDIEWFRARYSEAALAKTLSQSAITVTVSRSGKFHASIRAYTPESGHDPTGMECGIDLGVRDCATIAIAPEGSATADGDRHLEMNFDREKARMIEARVDHLRKLQSRRVKTWLRLNADGDAKGLTMHGIGSHNATAAYLKGNPSRSYRQCEKRIAVLSEKLASIRKDFAEKLSRKVADMADNIGLEDLNVKGMSKNHRLARSVLRVGFYGIRMAIERKAKGRVSLADRWMPSSKTCSHCGAHNPDLKSEHEWTCPSCGRRVERDRNAATNLRPSMRHLAGANMGGRKDTNGRAGRPALSRRDKGMEATPMKAAQAMPSMDSRKTERKETPGRENAVREHGLPCGGTAVVETFWHEPGTSMDGRQMPLF